MQELAFWGALALYGVSAVAWFAWAAFRRARAASVGVAAAALGLAPHAAAVGLRWAEIGHGPYNTRYEAFSSNALLLVAAWLLASRLARGLAPLGVLVVPVAALLMGLGIDAFDVRNDMPIIFKSGWLAFHIGFAKVFVTAALVAGACAAVFLVKRGRPAALPSLPSIERLDLYAHQCMLLSFLALGVMIAAGSLWAHQSWGRYWAWDPIETASLVTWIAFAVILHFRVLHGWSGGRMAWLTLVGLGFALTTLYVVVIVVPTIHMSYLVGK
jgi:ABC-type transport system involved in cytochrome c biogenesis permease subunit